MEQHQWHHRVHGHRIAQFVHSSDPISIAVGRESHQGPALNHTLLKRGKITVNRFGVNPAEKRIAWAANCLDIEFTAGKETLDPVASGSMHRVNHYRSF